MTTPLAISKREAGRLLKMDRGSTLQRLIDAGLLREIPWGRGRRIPLAEVQRLADKGFTLPDSPPRKGRAPRRKRAAVDPYALRQLDVEAL